MRWEGRSLKKGERGMVWCFEDGGAVETCFSFFYFLAALFDIRWYFVIMIIVIMLGYGICLD